MMSPEIKDAFTTLGLPETATQDEVKKAYRKLIVVWHEDKYDPDKIYQPENRTLSKEEFSTKGKNIIAANKTLTTYFEQVSQPQIIQVQVNRLQHLIQTIQTLAISQDSEIAKPENINIYLEALTLLLNLEQAIKNKIHDLFILLMYLQQILQFQGNQSQQAFKNVSNEWAFKLIGDIERMFIFLATKQKQETGPKGTEDVPLSNNELLILNNISLPTVYIFFDYAETYKSIVDMIKNKLQLLEFPYIKSLYETIPLQGKIRHLVEQHLIPDYINVAIEKAKNFNQQEIIAVWNQFNTNIVNLILSERYQGREDNAVSMLHHICIYTQIVYLVFNPADYDNVNNYDNLIWILQYQGPLSQEQFAFTSKAWAENQDFIARITNGYLKLLDPNIQKAPNFEQSRLVIQQLTRLFFSVNHFNTMKEKIKKIWQGDLSPQQLVDLDRIIQLPIELREIAWQRVIPILVPQILKKISGFTIPQINEQITSFNEKLLLMQNKPTDFGCVQIYTHMIYFGFSTISKSIKLDALIALLSYPDQTLDPFFTFISQAWANNKTFMKNIAEAYQYLIKEKNVGKSFQESIQKISNLFLTNNRFTAMKANIKQMWENEFSWQLIKTLETKLHHHELSQLIEQLQQKRIIEEKNYLTALSEKLNELNTYLASDKYLRLAEAYSSSIIDLETKTETPIRQQGLYQRIINAFLDNELKKREEETKKLEVAFKNHFNAVANNDSSTLKLFQRLKQRYPDLFKLLVPSEDKLTQKLTTLHEHLTALKNSLATLAEQLYELRNALEE